MVLNPHKLGVHKILQHIPLNALLDQPFQSALKKAVNVGDLRLLAKSRAHRMVFDYMDGGADDEITLRRNKDAYTALEMHYKVLSGIQPPLDLSTTIFGKNVKLPFFACPCAGNKMFHHEGELAVAKVSEENGMLYSLSSLSTTSIPDISQVFTGPKVFQLYVWKDRAIVADILSEARAGNFDVLALTVDVSCLGNRERDIRNEFTIPPMYTLKQTIEAIKKPAWTYDFLSHEPYKYACINTDVSAESLVSFIGAQLSPDFSWQDAEWLLGEWNAKTIVKGIVRPEEAKRAVELGFDSVWVSNHGGRQMDGAPATIDVLPSIRKAIGHDVEIVLDGGIQRGTDIAKAIALGADVVGVGRPYLWGLAAGGQAGVAKAFDILRVELDRAMGLLGTPTVQALKDQGPLLVKRRHVSARDYPDVHSAERGYGGGII